MALHWDWPGRSAIEPYDAHDRVHAVTPGRLRAVLRPPALAAAVSDSLAPREDRDPAARPFPASGADALRTSIGKSCKALGVLPFSPHDLRHRRISVLHRRGRSFAKIAAFVEHGKLSISADVYTHVLD